MHKHKTQVAVLGAGPAGLIAARQLGLAGVDVLLIDANVPASGHVIESFPASGAPLMDEIGLLGLVCECSDGPAESMHMVWRDAPEVRTFEGNGPLLLHKGLLNDRLRKDAMQVVTPLAARVRSVAAKPQSALVVTDAGTVQCKLVIDARGRAATKRVSSDLIALAFSARCKLPAHAMCLEAMHVGWIWATALPGDKVHGALFQRAAVLAGMNAAARAAYAENCLLGSDILAGVLTLEVGTPEASGLSAAISPVLADRHILVGDARISKRPYRLARFWFMQCAAAYRPQLRYRQSLIQKVIVTQR